MRRLLPVLLICLMLPGCATKSTPSVVVKEPAKYCPRPPKPEIKAPRTISELLDAYLEVVDYSLKEEATIDCYEEGNKE